MGLLEEVSRGRRWSGRRGICGDGREVVVPSGLRAVQRCNAFCHGGYKNENSFYVAPPTFPSGAYLGPIEMDQVA